MIPNTKLSPVTGATLPIKSPVENLIGFSCSNPNFVGMPNVLTGK
jgi:hypothetical protein